MLLSQIIPKSRFFGHRAGLLSWLLSAGLLASSCSVSRPTGLGAQAGFPVGTSVGLEKLQANATYRGTIEREFSSLTAEVAMKMDAIQPRPNEFAYGPADALVKFARQHHQRVHGHTLVWGGALPPWVQQFQGDSAAWEQLFKQQIQGTIRHFGSRVKAWDVVNEAFEGDGSLTKTIWRTHLGPGYVVRAFRYAREAAPKALLFYNDWDLEVNPNKLDHALQLLAELKAQGIRVDGLGFQMHTSIDRSVGAIGAALRKAAAQGYLIHLSEVDVEINRGGQLSAGPPPAELLARQRQFVQDLVAAYRQLPPAQQYGITFWGASDGDTWLRGYKHHPEWPLLLDDDYRPKPAYEGFREGLKAPLAK